MTTLSMRHTTCTVHIPSSGSEYVADTRVSENLDALLKTRLRTDYTAAHSSSRMIVVYVYSTSPMVTFMLHHLPRQTSCENHDMI